MMKFGQDIRKNPEQGKTIFSKPSPAAIVETNETNETNETAKTGAFTPVVQEKPSDLAELDAASLEAHGVFQKAYAAKMTPLTTKESKLAQLPKQTYHLLVDELQTRAAKKVSQRRDIQGQTSEILLREFLQDADLSLDCYCNRTGQLIHTISDDHLKNLVGFAEICRTDQESETLLRRLGDTIERLNLTAISPLWAETSPENLARLQIYDPAGYAVYGISLIAELHVKHEITSTHVRPGRELKRRRIQDKKEAYKLAQSLPRATLALLNETIRLANSSVLFRNLENNVNFTLPFDTCAKTLQNHDSAISFISAVALTLATLLQENPMKALGKLDPSQFYSLRKVYGTHENFRKQKQWFFTKRAAIKDLDTQQLVHVLPLMQAFAPSVAGMATIDARELAETEARVYKNDTPISALKQATSGMFGARRDPALDNVSTFAHDEETMQELDGLLTSFDMNLADDLPLDDETFLAELFGTSADIFADTPPEPVDDVSSSMLSAFALEPDRPKPAKPKFGKAKPITSTQRQAMQFFSDTPPKPIGPKIKFGQG